MNEVSETSAQATSLDSPSAISSQGLGSGLTRCAALGFLTVREFGQAVAPANLSATQAAALGLTMSGISGRPGFISSRSASLSSSLVSKLQARTASRGSILFTLTWKKRSTPSQRSISALRASVRRTSVKDSGLLLTGWRSPNVVDSRLGSRNGPGQVQLCHQALLAGGGTPTANVPGGTAERSLERKQAAVAAGSSMGICVSALNWQADLAGWPTHNARDFKHGPTETYGERSGTTKGDSLLNLVSAVCGGWATPRAEDAESSGMRHSRGVTDTLTAQTSLAHWQTPATDSFRCRGGDRKDEMGLDQQARTIPLPALRMNRYGQVLTGSIAEITSGGQLRPGHSRWLMALPSVWDSCGVTAMQSMPLARKPSSKPTLAR